MDNRYRTKKEPRARLTHLTKEEQRIYYEFCDLLFEAIRNDDKSFSIVDAEKKTGLYEIRQRRAKEQ